MQRQTCRAEGSAFGPLLWPFRSCRQRQGQWFSPISDSSLRSCTILLTENHETLTSPHTGARDKRSSTATSQHFLLLTALGQQGRNWPWVGVVPAPYRTHGAAVSSYLPTSLQGNWISKLYSSKETMKLFLALTEVFSSKHPRLCSPPRCGRSASLFSAGTNSCDVPGALGGLPVHFVSPVATILNTEQMFISTEMALIPLQLFSWAATMCECFFPGAKRCQAQQAALVTATSMEGRGLARHVAGQHQSNWWPWQVLSLPGGMRWAENGCAYVCMCLYVCTAACVHTRARLALAGWWQFGKAREKQSPALSWCSKHFTVLVVSSQFLHHIIAALLQAWTSVLGVMRPLSSG